eukprot:COSAG02_NODE_27947_length_599_cov_1.428000_2_plen_58_part_00
MRALAEARQRSHRHYERVPTLDALAEARQRSHRHYERVPTLDEEDSGSPWFTGDLNT